VQEVGKFCSKTDHHPEWRLVDGGKAIEVKLTSHFANNTATIFDFELAEQMNEQAIYAGHEFSMYTYLSNQAKTSWKIFIVGYIFGALFLQFALSLSKKYPTQGPVQASQYRPLVVPPFKYHIGALEKTEEAERIACAYVDELAFKDYLFADRKFY